jgi:hypothetical protein
VSTLALVLLTSAGSQAATDLKVWPGGFCHVNAYDTSIHAHVDPIGGNVYNDTGDFYYAWCPIVRDRASSKFDITFRGYDGHPSEVITCNVQSYALEPHHTWRDWETSYNLTPSLGHYSITINFSDSPAPPGGLMWHAACELPPDGCNQQGQPANCGLTTLDSVEYAEIY